MEGAPGEVTLLLHRLSGGDRSAEDELLERVYLELHRLAMARLHSERGSHTLQATALVHEAYLRLCRTDSVNWNSRAHFYRTASRSMRRILVDYARQRGAKKRNDGVVALPLDGAITISADQTRHAIDVDELLDQLAELNPRQAQVVEMKFFGGMTDKEIAAALDVDVRTIGRDWAKARAWLHSRISGEDAPDCN